MTLVFTNGVFDLLHVDHLRLLQFARQQGDRLVVGINSDESTRRIKGLSRPIIPSDQRAELLRGLACVDDVEVFEEDTPIALIERLMPDVLVKGPEASNPPGAAFVDRVVIQDRTVEQSTSRIIDAIRTGGAVPISQCLQLQVGGVGVDPNAGHSIRFTVATDGVRPVLYSNHRRVIESWSVRLCHQQPADPHGRSG